MEKKIEEIFSYKYVYNQEVYRRYLTVMKKGENNEVEEKPVQQVFLWRVEAH